MQTLVTRPGELPRLLLAFLIITLPSTAFPHDQQLAIEPAPASGTMLARHLEDRNHIAIIELSGNYDRYLPNGAFNQEPRELIAKAFFDTHTDNYDFLIVFSTFEFDTAEATAFHLGIQNQVEGIGLPVFDYTEAFGSDGRLQGYIDMAALSRYEMEPLRPGFETTLAVLNHEILHQWAAYVRFQDTDGSVSDDLIGHDDVHWSFLLDTDASVLYGNDWQDNADGTFTSVDGRTFFSPLDLYLAGFFGPEEVPPLLLIDSPGIDKNRLPEKDVTIEGVGRWITINDVIAVEGPRVPAAADAQQEFQAAFILLMRPGQVVTDAQIAALNHTWEGLLTRFTALTGGRGLLQVYPEIRTGATTGSPKPLDGGDLRPSDSSLTDALAWLRSQQTGEGFWEDLPSTRVRDTAVALAALAFLDARFDGRDEALAWLATHDAPNTDFLARQAMAVEKLRQDAAPLRNQLTNQQNRDGGWGAAADFESDPLDTALVILALSGHLDVVAAVVEDGISYLLNSQEADGGWGSVESGPSRTMVTATVLRALALLDRVDPAAPTALVWLAGRQHNDGGFGDDQSTAHDTAHVLGALLALEAMQAIDGERAANYLRTRQTVAGSWEGSVYTTALVAAVLKRLAFPNWTITEPVTAIPPMPRDGERVELLVTVGNDGNAPTPAGVLRIYNGDPSTGGTPIGEDREIPVLAPQQTVTVTTLWDTFGQPGNHTLVAVLDPENTLAELSELDNRATLGVEVLAAPAQADLEVRAGDITIFPPQPQQLPIDLAISVTVRNLGLENVADVKLRLWEGVAGEGTLLEETTLMVPGRSSSAANFSYGLTTAGTTEFTVEVDPDDRIAEADETNNRAATSVNTMASVDLEVRAEDLLLVGGVAPVGNDATFRVTLRNRGTLDAPSTQVRYQVTDGQVVKELGSHTIQPRGGETLERNITWRVDLTGDLQFIVELDPDGFLAETEETNNRAALNFTATTLKKPNLVVDHRDIHFDPEPGLEGQALNVSALVRNTGGQGVDAVQVAIYEGDPAHGGQQLGAMQDISRLEAGESVTVNWIAPSLVGAEERLVFVVVDPNEAIAEFSEEDNAAFTGLEVLGMADLALDAGSLRLSPRFPRPGEQVTLMVSVANLGEQTAENVVIRAYDGDPAIDGQPVGNDQTLPLVEGGRVGEVSFTWTYAAAGDIRPIVVRVDPEDGIAEAAESNNSARLDVAVQSRDFFVSHRYFSPNGDGVKDTSAFFFRLEQLHTVSIEILNRKDEIVRRHQGSGLTEITDGQFDWDGLDHQGRVVRDGDYRLRVVSQAGTVLGEAMVTVDTNRSSLLEAVGTPFEDYLNLTCELPTVKDLRITADGEVYFFIVPPHQSDFEPGIYRMSSSGDDLRLMVPEAVLEGHQPFSLAITENGARVAFVAGGRLWLADGNGAGLQQIDSLTSISEIYGFSATGALIVLQNSGNVVSVTLDDGIPSSQMLYTMALGHGIQDVVFSPDRRGLVLQDSSPHGPYRVMFLNLETSTNRELLFLDSPPPESSFSENLQPPRYAWSPDSAWLVVTDPNAAALRIHTADGRLQQVHLVPEDSPPFELVGRHDVPVDPEIWDISTPAWSASSTTLAIKAFYRDLFWSPQDPYEYNMFSYTKILSFDLPSAHFDSVGWSEPGHTWGRSYHVSTWDGSSWVERGVLHYGPRYQEQRLDLSTYLPDPNGEFKVRIRQSGGDAARVEAVSMFVGDERVVPVSAVLLDNDADVLSQLRYQDNRVLDLLGRELELRWDDLPQGRVSLALDAQEELSTHQSIVNPAQVQASDDPHDYTFVPAQGTVHWAPDEQALFYVNNVADLDSIALLLDEENRQLLLFEDFYRFEPDQFAPSGREFLFRSSDARNDPASVCYERGYDDVFSFRSLANLTADLQAGRSSSAGGVPLDGTAADANFSHYVLEFANLGAPSDWKPIAPPAGQQIVHGRFTTWVPPEPGIYQVRLTVEDLAGNQRQAVRRVAWTEEAASITDLFREPAIISPNGDGVQDEMVAHYRVLEPVNLEFRFFSKAGEQVRRIERNHSLSGATFQLPWNGRDDDGLLLPDGEYRMVVQDFELFVTLDSTPPEAEIVLSDARQQDSQGYIQVDPRLSFGVQETHFEGLTLETGEGGDPVSWEAIDITPMFDPNDPTYLMGSRGLNITEFVNHRFRLHVADAAGNETVTVTPLGAEELIVNRFGLHRLTDSLNPLVPNGYEDLEPVPFTGQPPFELESGEVRFAVTETIRGALTQLFIQFREYRSEGEMLPPWFETRVETFLQPDRIPSVTIPETRFETLWDLQGVPGGVEIEVRLKALDIEGNEHFSNVFNILTDSIQFGGAVTLADESGPYGQLLTALKEKAFASDRAYPGDFLLWGIEFVEESLTDVTLYLRSSDDPRYAVEVALEPVAINNNGFLFKFNDPLPCKHYEGFLQAETVPQDGQPSRTLTSGVEKFEFACVAVSAEVEAPTFGDCGENQVSTDRLVKLTARSLNGVVLTLLTLSKVEADGFEDVLFSVNQPASGRIYSYELGTGDWAEGSYMLRARISNGEGEQAYQDAWVVVDRTPLSLAITYPQQNGRLCGIVQETSFGPRNTFGVEGLIEDDFRFSYFLELDTQANPQSFEEIVEDRACYGRFSEILKNKDRALCGPKLGGSLAVYGDDQAEADFSGEATIRLHAFDWSGHHVCEEVSFFFDGEVEGATAKANLELFSPNGDDALDQLQISYYVDEPAFLDIEVYAAALINGEAVSNGPVLRHIADETQVSGNGYLIWDGLDDNDQVMTDGLYGIVLNFRDTCGNLARREIFAEVDTTPPEISIAYPHPGDPLPLVVEIWGSVEDPNIKTYSVDSGAGVDPIAWINLGTGFRNMEEQLLATWNTFGLQGDFTLRLSAVDSVGNHNEVRILLDLNSPVNLITYIEPTPRLFSPNSDNRREFSSIRFGVDVPVEADLTILDEAGEPMRTLLESAPLNPGATIRDWDGYDDSGNPVDDGPYTAVLDVRMIGNPAVTQEERVTIILDSTPPEVEITRPVVGYISGSGSVIGKIQDPHLVEYVVSLTDTPNTPIWRELEQGATNRVDYAFGSLSGLQEGDYALRVEAWDEGESYTERIIPFVVDNTPPAVNLSEPASGTILGAAGGPVQIIGGVQEANLLGYRVDVGAGETPESWTTLVSAGLPPTDSRLTLWDVSGLADGPYTLRLMAVDRASLFSESQVSVIVDNKLPIADIQNLEDDDFIIGPKTINGTASDTNLVGYQLAVAPGSGASANQWSEIGQGAQSVLDAMLLDWQALPPDGSYTLRLKVSDGAGNEALALREIHVDLNPPAPPQNLAAILENSYDATLSWRANTEPDLVGYRVYREGVRVGSELVAETGFLDAELPEGIHTYTVTAVDRAAWESKPSDSVTVVVDVTGPTARLQKPLDGARVGGLVDIKGVAYSQDDFKEYRLYVGPQNDPTASQLLRRSPVPVLNGLLARWNTAGLAENTKLKLRLETEDLKSNVATAEIAVTVDNLPPVAPTGLMAKVSGSDVILSWNPNAEPDLLGYLVFRDGFIANAPGVVVDDFTPYVVTSSSYLDGSRPDGTFEYEVYALDQAGNLSAPSLPATATVDARAPQALIEEPADGHRFDQPLAILATTVDEDISWIQFQYKAVESSEWNALGDVDTAPPWEIVWDPGGLPFGNYHLRAIATDVGGRVDPSPVTITVVYADVTPPARVEGLSIRVDGGDVTLTWSASSENDLDGYHVDRTDASGETTRITTAPLAHTTYMDTGLGDGRYSYTVVAVDHTNNTSEPSEKDHALVYTPGLEQPYTPTTEIEMTLTGVAVANARVSAVIVNTIGTMDLPTIQADEEGHFSIGPVELERGDNTLHLRATDTEGNISKTAVVVVISSTAPSAPTGLEAIVMNNREVSLQWNPNPETDIIGYRPFRDSESLLPDISLSGLSASASSEWSASHSAANVLDPREHIYWAPWTGENQSAVGQWLMVSWPESRLIAQVNLNWYSDHSTKPLRYAALDYDLETWDGRAWVKVARVRENDHANNSITLSQPYRTTRLRILLLRSRFADTIAERVRLARVEILGRSYESGISFDDTVTDGEYQYTLTALNQYGFESPSSQPTVVKVGDTTPPSTVTLSAISAESNVELSWTASNSPDVIRYDLYRDGVKFAEHTDLESRFFVDENRPNGTYRYTVIAVDAVGNNSDPSNEVEVTIVAEPLPSPINLTVSQVPAGSALDLSWEAGDDGASVTVYRLYRATLTGGPFEPIVTTPDKHYRDFDLINGVTYYYVVTGLDVIGNESTSSEEASGMPEDTLVPVKPILHDPAYPGLPFVTTELFTKVTGTTEPGTTVSLFRSGRKVGETLALATNEQHIASFAEAAELSPDGRYLWIREPSGHILYDYETDTQVVVPAVTGSPRWSRDSRSLIFADERGIRVYRIDDGTTEDVMPANNVLMAVPSPEGSRLAVLGEYDGIAGLFILDLEASTWDLLSEDTDYQAIGPYTLNWSPDGLRLVYTRSSPNPAIEVLSLASRETQTIETQPGFGMPHWSPDGAALVYTSTVSGSSKIVRYRVADGNVLALSTSVAEAPQWSPDGRAVAYITDDAEVLYQDLETGKPRLLYDAEPLTWYGRPLLQWSPDGHLGILASYGQVRLTLAGRFAFEDISLDDGDNVFAAIAEDAAGNSSAVSEAIVVTVSVDERPDLALIPAELVVLPGIALVGDTVRISVTARNTGRVASAETDLSLVVLGPDGFSASLVGGPTLNSLPPGGFQTIRHDFMIPNVPGIYTVVAVADPLDSIAEISESNNWVQHEWVVASDRKPVLSLTTGRNNYLNNEDIIADVELVNPGSFFKGRIELRIEDDQGFLVTELSPITEVDLDFGERFADSVIWNTGLTFAGNYRLRAALMDAQGATVQTDAVPFSIAKVVQLASQVTTDRGQYFPDATMSVTGTVQYVTGNSYVSGVMGRFVILDDTGETLAEFVQPLSGLLPEDETNISVEWNHGTLAAGTYQVMFSAERDGAVLSQSRTFFEIIESTLWLEGELNLSDRTPAVGDSLTVDFAITNLGNTMLTTLPVSIRLDDGINGDTLALETMDIDLALGEQVSSKVDFSTEDLSPQNYLVVLVAAVPVDVGQTVSWVLQVASLSLLDQTPPTVKIDRPKDGDVLKTDPRVIVTVFDKHSEIQSTEVNLDGGDWIRLLASGSDASEYIGEITGLVDGSHWLRARAFDAWGNKAETDIIQFTLDRTPPVITISGVEDGGEYSAAVTPVIQVFDANPGTELLALNGEPFVSGTKVEREGSHILEVTALDVAGNRSGLSIEFQIVGDSFAALTASMVDELAVDEDSDSKLDPGEILSYQVEVTNIGSELLTNVVFENALPTHTVLVPGSLIVTGGEIWNDNPITVKADTLVAGAVMKIRFEVRVENLVPRDITAISNQGVVYSHELPPVLTDDPALPGKGDPTVTPLENRISVIPTISGWGLGLQALLLVLLACWQMGRRKHAP